MSLAEHTQWDGMKCVSIATAKDCVLVLFLKGKNVLEKAAVLFSSTPLSPMRQAVRKDHGKVFIALSTRSSFAREKGIAIQQKATCEASLW